MAVWKYFNGLRTGVAHTKFFEPTANALYANAEWKRTLE